MSDDKPQNKSQGGKPTDLQQDSTMNAQDSPKPSKGGLNPEIQARIGHQLRALYDDVVRQGVPDRFADLIRKLDSQEAADAVRRTNNIEGSE